MICPNCLKEIPDGQSFCQNCGSPLDASTVGMEATRPTEPVGATETVGMTEVVDEPVGQEAGNGINAKRCPHCHKLIPADSYFCRHCGEDLLAWQDQDENMADENEPGRGGFSDRGKKDRGLKYKGPGKDKPGSDQSGLLLFMLGALIVILIIVIILIIRGLLGSDGGSGGTTQQASTQTTATQVTTTQEASTQTTATQAPTTRQPVTTTATVSKEPASFEADYRVAKDLSNYRFVAGNTFSFYVPEDMYDSKDVSGSKDSFLYYSSYNDEDFARFSENGYGGRTREKMMDVLDGQYSKKEKHMILKRYPKDDDEGVGRLVYDLPAKNIYRSYSFYKNKYYLLEIGERPSSSKKEARWMDYYINVLYRGCSFTRNVGKMYTYEEYLKEN